MSGDLFSNSDSMGFAGAVQRYTNNLLPPGTDAFNKKKKLTDQYNDKVNTILSTVGDGFVQKGLSDTVSGVARNVKTGINSLRGIKPNPKVKPGGPKDAGTDTSTPAPTPKPTEPDLPDLPGQGIGSGTPLGGSTAPPPPAPPGATPPSTTPATDDYPRINSGDDVPAPRAGDAPPDDLPAPKPTSLTQEPGVNPAAQGADLAEKEGANVAKKEGVNLLKKEGEDIVAGGGPEDPLTDLLALGLGIGSLFAAKKLQKKDPDPPPSAPAPDTTNITQTKGIY